MTKSKNSYVVIEDDLLVCEGIKLRMNKFQNWYCIGLIPEYEGTLKIIQKINQICYS